VRRSILSTTLLAVLLLASVPAAWSQGAPTATAELRDRTGKSVATADLHESQNEVLITLTFARDAPLTGTHAIHIHDRGRCGGSDFGGAGGIFNPQGKQHGLLNPAGPMVGDLPDIVLGPTGLARYNVSAPLATLRPGPASLLGPGGTAIVIDAGQDDNRTQPDGNSGARIACGIILAPGQAAPSAEAPALLSPLVLAGLGVCLILVGMALPWWRRRREIRGSVTSR